MPEQQLPQPQVPEHEMPEEPVGQPPRIDLVQAAPRRARTRAPRHLADLAPDERVAAVRELGQPGFRARQLSTHYFGRCTRDPAAMTDLPLAARADLVEALLPTLLTPVAQRTADSGATVKTVWRLAGGDVIESVLMRYPDRATLCVSSQAGCGMACPFCATGQGGLQRNLTTAEIVEQVIAAAALLRDGTLPGGDTAERTAPLRVTNIVFMGMGEPLANYAATVTALRRITDPAPAGFGLSARRIVVSSVGLVPAIDRMAAEELPVTLALSLHAPDDELRDELVPVNRRFPVSQALDAAHRYYRRTGRRVSVEYALIRDVNDQAWRARRLAELLLARGRGWVHVNPIPLNPTPGSRWTASRPSAQRRFVEALTNAGIPTTVRDTRGQDIDGACGQLAPHPAG